MNNANGFVKYFIIFEFYNRKKNDIIKNTTLNRNKHNLKRTK